MRSVICTIAAATLAFWVIGSMATAQQGSSTQQAISANPASNPDQELGRRVLIKPENLPSPKTDPVAASRSLLIPYAEQTPRVMEGFTVTPFVTGLEHPRRLLVLPNNDVIVAEQRTGYLTLLRDQDGDGKADFIQRYADDFKAPYGLAYRDGFVLVADQEGIWRVPHVSGAVRGGRPDQPKISDVPPEQRAPVPAAYGQELITQRRVFGVVAGHQNRHLALDPKTGAMFVGVGSAGNIGVEPEVKASIQRFIRWLQPNYVCLWNAQPDDARIPSHHGRTVRRGSGARRTWRQSSARLPDPRRKRCLLRLAICIYRVQPAAGL